MITARQVVDHILWSMHESGSFVSNLKLQKLLYYVQAWHLAIFQRPLFAEKFEAWVHGPVIPEIYHQFRDYGWRNIDVEVQKPALDPRTVAFIEEVLEEYGPLDARRLEYLTHREEPWLAPRRKLQLTPEEHCTATIDEDSMHDYYRLRLNVAEIEDLLQGVEGEETAAS